ncbi:MAG TPA: dihydropteroate synthase [Gammaproteobacteria bacterium]|nr:dihydropteroate synthase [Gammaproteobacteria bacterium]MCH78401.1 dihydropteroate synthase [Gammaproteobacteria bacterium]
MANASLYLCVDDSLGDAGAQRVIAALREAGALKAAAELGVPVALMHMQGQPRTMQQAPNYADVVADVAAFLGERVQACREAGIVDGRLLLDPGFGFGKTPEHNLALLGGLPTLAALGFPLLVGLSRKSLIGAVTGAPVQARLGGSVALAVLAAERGARLIRVHDVAETVQALSMLDALTAIR